MNQRNSSAIRYCNFKRPGSVGSRPLVGQRKTVTSYTDYGTIGSKDGAIYEKLVVYLYLRCRGCGGIGRLGPARKQAKQWRSCPCFSHRRANADSRRFCDKNRNWQKPTLQSQLSEKLPTSRISTMKKYSLQQIAAAKRSIHVLKEAVKTGTATFLKTAWAAIVRPLTTAVITAGLLAPPMPIAPIAQSTPPIPDPVLIYTIGKTGEAGKFSYSDAYLGFKDQYQVEFSRYDDRTFGSWRRKCTYSRTSLDASAKEMTEITTRLQGWNLCNLRNECLRGFRQFEWRNLQKSEIQPTTVR